MKITRKTELIIERTRTIKIKLGNVASARFCPFCYESLQFITIDEAASVRQTTARRIFRLVEQNLLHFIETDKGALLICFASLCNVSLEHLVFSETLGQNQS